MAGQIRMTPETMRQRASQYRQEGEKMQQVIDKMTSLLAQLQQEWEGDAARGYAQKFNELKPGFKEARELIQKISDSLNKSAQIVEETDRRLGQQFRA